MNRILIFSSLCKSKDILELTIPSWIGMEKGNLDVEILLYNDNRDADAFAYVDSLPEKHSSITVVDGWFNEESTYKNHNWTLDQVDRIIHIKNRVLELAQENKYDAVFLIDADLVLHPKTLLHLESLKKDFVFEIFWTVFTDQLFAKPNCWDVHSWSYHNAQSILRLKEAGTYQIGAGGACTLLSSNAINAGVNFEKINNLSYGGEDRHICTRAEVLGFPIFVDTFFPAFHIFEKNLLKNAKDWISLEYSREYFDSWLDQSWEDRVIQTHQKEVPSKPKNEFDRIRKALYKAKRAYINYMRYN
ncbi:hypothetical protein [Nonlabens antarcticus]|uniref:hypothetical protein n=1 Tax=Nonlabens antarcticus TaxID=392714 RepID=UPI001890CD8F|nr:hypothetical protein [Nonlabens antarcticus]